jgi:hypothetical protein
MPRSPSIVPEASDRDVYLVLDDFGGRLGLSWRETGVGKTDRATLLRELMEGSTMRQCASLFSMLRGDGAST